MTMQEEKAMLGEYVLYLMTEPKEVTGVAGYDECLADAVYHMAEELKLVTAFSPQKGWKRNVRDTNRVREWPNQSKERTGGGQGTTQSACQIVFNPTD